MSEIITFGAWLKQYRRQQDLTQQELADQLGVSINTVRKIERDERRPSKQLAEIMAETFNIHQEKQAAFIPFARFEPHTPESSEAFANFAETQTNEPITPSPPHLVTDTSQQIKHNLPTQPTPFLGRDAIVDPALRAFEAKGIFSRGRFGAWKYEVANQDHSFAQGYECVERLVANGGPEYEPTLFTPEVVNSQRNP